MNQNKLSQNLHSYSKKSQNFKLTSSKYIPVEFKISNSLELSTLRVMYFFPSHMLKAVEKQSVKDYNMKRQ